MALQGPVCWPNIAKSGRLCQHSDVAMLNYVRFLAVQHTLSFIIIDSGSCSESSGPLLRSWPISALQLARRGGRRATADLSKRTIIAGCGPHVWRH